MTSEGFRIYLKVCTWVFSIFLFILIAIIFFSLAESITAGKIITIVIILIIHFLIIIIRRFFNKSVAEITFDEKNVYFLTYSKNRIIFNKNHVTEIKESIGYYIFIFADNRRYTAIKYTDPISALKHQNKYDNLITIENFPNAIIR